MSKKHRILKWLAKWSDALLIGIWAYWLVQVPLYPEGIFGRFLGLAGSIPMAWATKNLVLLGEEYNRL